MSTPDDVITVLEHLAPLRLAAEWDNVGFLVGTKRPTIQRVMTCLTLTMEIAREAVSQKADLIVTHHPLPFRPVNRITEATATGGILLELLTAGIGVWSGHTAWDSAAQGINAMLADMLSLQNIAPLFVSSTRNFWAIPNREPNYQIPCRASRQRSSAFSIIYRIMPNDALISPYLPGRVC